MSIINPGVGDLADRLIVLDLKLTRKESATTEQRAQWAEEKRIIANKLLDTFDPFSELENSVAYCALGSINARIWELEDILSDYLVVDTDPVAIANVAVEIKLLNNSRAVYVHELNAEADPERESDK